MTDFTDAPYHHFFDPHGEGAGRVAPPVAAGDAPVAEYSFWDDALVLAVNVALATGRPLLLGGRSGTGKSAAARAIAEHLDWRFLPTVMTSRTQAQDLLYEVDHLHRLQDAQTSRLGKPERYIRPGVLGRAFNPGRAAAVDAERPRHEGADELPAVPDERRAVVLVDEIDKAEVDVPNNLLIPFGSLSFEVEVAGEQLPTVEAGQLVPLVIITNNEERSLPRAFLRRCIQHRIEVPTWEQLEALVVAYRGAAPKGRPGWGEVPRAVSAYLSGRASDDEDLEPNHEVTPAAFIDAVRAVDALHAEGGSALWTRVLELTGRDREVMDRR